MTYIKTLMLGHCSGHMLLFYTIFIDIILQLSNQGIKHIVHKEAGNRTQKHSHVDLGAFPGCDQ